MFPGTRAVITTRDACKPVSFSVSATAQNAVFMYPPNPANESDILGFIHSAYLNSTGPLLNGTTTITGNYTVNGLFCAPVKNPRNALQVLVHGITYNKTMWEGLGLGADYNWHGYAQLQGYHTLAIDRLSHGDDTQDLDPITTVQGPLQLEIIHQLIQAIRNTGANNALGQSFKRIAYVGHSYGSILGTALAGKYPDDIDALVCTGFSAFINGSAILNTWNISSAAHTEARFAKLPLGYVASQTEAVVEAMFYAGDYDKAIPPVNFAYHDTMTVGEVCYTGFAGPVNYTKPVALIVGELDKIFCNSATMGCPNILDQTGNILFPNTTANWFTPQLTGHELTLHNSAQITFQWVHNIFLNTIFTSNSSR
ncbi:Alpha/Beta hydrolase protein [Diplogelasinospora grovesii]|uniref:Alpha/Beta hydrolase protein n=1 Tax=Diplogelasinospora grovesii TaxID=303347 RepID=A0AAN6N1J4_9PEZI|nr:Alpha/Beta hydrolase protein [Diplogelasinospora grovesii]